MPVPTTPSSPTPGASATGKPPPPTTAACAATSSTTSKESTSTPSATHYNAAPPPPTTARPFPAKHHLDLTARPAPAAARPGNYHATRVALSGSLLCGERNRYASSTGESTVTEIGLASSGL